MLVSVSPVLAHMANFGGTGEVVTIKEFCAEGTIEAFDERLLRGLPGLDVQQFDTALLGPLFQRGTDEFSAIVQT